jgi:hypothetical protein
MILVNNKTRLLRISDTNNMASMETSKALEIEVRCLLLIAGDKLYLRFNNLDLSEGSEDMENIRALEDRGVKVYYE